MIEIKHRFTGAVICSFDVSTIKEALEQAVGWPPKADVLYEDLDGANLGYADLFGVNLHVADLRRADLRYADLFGADLRGADLRYTNLFGANLGYADLRGANLRGADLIGANLHGANLRGSKISKLFIAQQNIVAEGQIEGWKKLKGEVIARIQIPVNAQRLNSLGSRKCRASMAFVMELSDGSQSGFDKHTGLLEYKVGEFVFPDGFDDSIYTDCSHGIHFFLSKIEAENY